MMPLLAYPLYFYALNVSMLMLRGAKYARHEASLICARHASRFRLRAAAGASSRPFSGLSACLAIGYERLISADMPGRRRFGRAA